MSGITNPAEEYFKDGLWGWVTDQWKKLVATAGGALHVQFAGQETDVEVKQTTPADLTPGVCGWDGDSWQKLPMVWGYSAHWAQLIQGTAVGAGDAGANTTVVPPGYVYRLEGLHLQHNAGADKSVVLYVDDAAVTIHLITPLTLGSGVVLVYTGRITLHQGDAVKSLVTAPGAGKSIWLSVWGYKMKIAE